MANPTLSKKSSNAPELNQDIKRLFQVIYREQNIKPTSENEVPKIKVSDLISKMSFYYEKIRNSVDYKEEHLLRKNAIERILRRQIVIEGAISIKGLKSEEISKHLLTELIRAAYLPNNTIPEAKIQELGLVIEKYIKLKNYVLLHHKKDITEKNELAHWIIALAASDLEERLGRSKVDEAVVNYMYKILAKSIVLPANSEYEKEKDIQIYIGIHRNYFKFDRDMMGYILFKYYNANWDNPSDEEIEKIAKNFKNLRQAIDRQIDHPLSGQMNRVISRYTVFFSILIDVISENPRAVYEGFKKDPKAFPRLIKNVCRERYKRSKSKLWRAAIRSIIYIFITKSIFAILLEIPATRFFGEELNTFSLAVNVSFPAVLLFLIVLFTRFPSDANSKRIVEGINQIVFSNDQRQEKYRLRQPVKRGAVLNTIFGIIYFFTFMLSFSFVIWGLNKLNFNAVSIIIFLFFLAFVSFFSIRIRKNIRELIIVPPKENILNLISDFFYIPIVAAGKWLSEKFSRINVFVFILDFIIEAPFKIFVEIAEQWTNYVKERKEEIV